MMTNGETFSAAAFSMAAGAAKNGKFLYFFTSATSLSLLGALRPSVSFQDYYWLIPPGLLFAGAFQIATYIAIRNKDFKGLTSANIQRSVGRAPPTRAIDITANTPRI